MIISNIRSSLRIVAKILLFITLPVWIVFGTISVGIFVFARTLWQLSGIVMEHKFCVTHDDDEE